MHELVPSFIVITIGAVLAALQAQRMQGWEAICLGVAFLGHMTAAIVQIVLTRAVYGGGDIFAYAGMGETLAALMRTDFGEFAPEVLKLLLHGEPYLPVNMSAGSSTGAMAAISGFLTYFTGAGIYTLSLIISLGSYFGLLAIYRAFITLFPDALRPRLMFATTLVPSAVFWSSALLKEGVATLGLGYLFLGLVRFRRAPSAIPAIQIAFGMVVVGLVKAYVLFPFVLAAGVWFFLESDGKTKRVIRPIHMAIGSIVAIGGVVALGALFPEYALENLAEQAAAYQYTGQQVPGGSTYSLGAPADGTASGQLEFVPLALITALFRPFVFEADSFLIAVNALETSILLFIVLRAISRRGVAGAIGLITESPTLVFCAIFTMTFGIAVGLTTTNLGTLSRYRMPLVPFFWALTLILDSRRFSGAVVQTAPAANPGIRRENRQFAAMISEPAPSLLL